MVGKAPSFGRHQHTTVLPRACRAFAHGITEVLRYGASRPQQIIQILALVQPRPFFIERRTLGHVALTFAKRLLHHRDTDDVTTVGNHVFVQFHIITKRISPIEISLPVVIHKDRGVDVSPFALRQRLSQRVVERAIRTVCHGYSDSTSPRFHRHGHVSIELASALHALHGPSITFRPRECFVRQYRSVVGPVHHVGGSIKLPIQHFEPISLCIVLVMGRIKEHGVIVHHRRGVGRVLGLDNGILCVKHGLPCTCQQCGEGRGHK